MAATRCVIPHGSKRFHPFIRKPFAAQTASYKNKNVEATGTGGAGDFGRPSCLSATTATGDAIRAAAPSSATPHLVFPGGGIYFYHQAGVMTFLRERYDLSSCTFAGASAGALAATLGAAGVDFREAAARALELARGAGVWGRRGGLRGIWGALIEEWLDALLPASIAPLQERVTLLVTPVPSFGTRRISRFEDREDLIRCNMASVHLPWFLDGKLTSNFRGCPHIDGSFLTREDDYSPNVNDGAYKSHIKTIALDWKKDFQLRSKGGLDIVEALSSNSVYKLMEQGERYGKVLEDRGVFEDLKHLS